MEYLTKFLQHIRIAPNYNQLLPLPCWIRLIYLLSLPFWIRLFYLLSLPFLSCRRFLSFSYCLESFVSNFILAQNHRQSVTIESRAATNGASIIYSWLMPVVFTTPWTPWSKKELYHSLNQVSTDHTTLGNMFYTVHSQWWYFSLVARATITMLNTAMVQLSMNTAEVEAQDREDVWEKDGVNNGQRVKRGWWNRYRYWNVPKRKVG